MDEPKVAGGSRATLREQAEAALRARDAQGSGGAPMLVTDELLHELQVHQIELEMQNDELRRALEELDRSRANYHDLYDFAPVGYCTLSEEGSIVQANLTAAALLGMARGALLKRPFTAFISDEDQDVFYLQRRQLAATGYVGSFALRMVRADRSPLWAQLAVSRSEAGGEAALRITLTDITERVRIEEQLRQLQRLEAIGQLTGGIAHDFNNLLTVIMGTADMLTEDLGGDAVRSPLAEMIVSAAQRGAHLTQRLLAFARRQVLAPRVIDINVLVDELDSMLRRALGEHIELTLSCAAGLPAVKVDTGQLEHSLLNLCLNSRDAMPNGGRLTIETGGGRLDDAYVAQHADLAAGDYVMICVTDTGSGIAPENLARVFDPFFTTKEAGKGTGLGLATVYGFVKQSGGHISIDSEPGVGTKVRMYLQALAGPATTDELEPDLTPVAGGTERILVVEDNDLVRSFAAAQLKSMGYEVLEAIDGERALAIIAGRADIDLLLTDVIMPGGMNGRRLAYSALLLRPRLKVLYTSGSAQNALVPPWIDPDFLAKPYMRRELCRRVRTALDGKSAVRPHDIPARCLAGCGVQSIPSSRLATRTMAHETFPIDLGQLKPLELDPSVATLSEAAKATLRHNIELCRDAIVFFTALAGAKGLSGHSGGAYDTVPEVMIVRAFIAHGAPIVPVFYDEAGHRVATQYLLSVLNGAMPAERLLHYREFNSGLPGHPEKMLTPGVEFSSGRLGHLWAFCNGVAMANPGKAVVLLGSDGSQMEGDNAEAARLAVGKQLNIKLLIDDNNVTIAGHPQEYMAGYDLTRTLAGYGLTTETTMGEDLDALYIDLCRAFNNPLPHALVIKRPMAPGIKGAEGSPHAHEVLKADIAIGYLEQRGHDRAIALLKAAKPEPSPLTYRGSSGAGKNRDDFGKLINEMLDGMDEAKRVATVRVFDNDLEGSCGLHHIRKKYPQVFVRGGIMERGNYSAAAGFGSSPGKQGIFATFSAFLEMCISEITMARLNFSNVLAHFSHSGVDEMADNTCHFGINGMFADGGVKPGHGEDTTRLYFPADQHQFAACVKRIFNDPGLRFLFSTRAPVPDILGEDGKPFYQGKAFVPGKDDLLRKPKEGGGYVVAVGEAVYRALDAVIGLEQKGVAAGLVNKATLNVVDESMMRILAQAPWVLVVEGWNAKTGLGGRFGDYLLRYGFKGRYQHLGTHLEGSGGLWQQMGYQGMDPAGISAAIENLQSQ